MNPSVSHSMSTTFGVRSILLDRASFYTASKPKKRKIVDRTLDVVTLEPDLFLQSNIEDALFKILDDVAQQELGRTR